MRSPRATTQQVCCDSSLCQHPDCWRLNLQRVREAVWRRNGIEPEDSTTTRSMNVDQVYLTKEQRLESSDGGLPTLKVVDMFSDLDDRIKSAPDRKLRQPNLNRRSTSLPSLSPDQSQPTASPQIRMPHPSPVISQSARTEYQRKMLWKKQFSNPSRAETSLSRGSGNSAKVATIGVHEVYEPEELCQDWEEVYVTSAYLVWCPSNKKKRKKRQGSSGSSRSNIDQPNSNKVIPKDVTEDFVPAAMETIKEIRPKSTKTPTGGQPYSPHKSPANLKHYGMEDLSDLPKPILSGMLKRITQRSNDVTPEQDPRKDPQMSSSPTTEPNTKTKKLLDGVELSIDFDSFVAKEEKASKVRLAVDINSRFTTPAEDEELEKQKELEKNEKEKQEAHATNILDLVKKVEDKPAYLKTSRELLRLNSIGVPIEDLPSPKSHHCMNSIPRRQSLGAALEPVNIVPIEGSPANTPPNEPQATQVARFDELKIKRSKNMNDFFVNIPHGRASSALERSPYYSEEDRLYIHQSFRNSPSPVRAPAPTPSSPDKYSEFFRQHSRISQAHRSTSLQEDEMLATMRRWNTFSYAGDTEEPSRLEGLAEDPISILRGSPVGRQVVEAHDDQNVSEERIFLTEGFETSERILQDRPYTPGKGFLIEDNIVLKEPDTRGRSPSPGSRTRIPKDIIEEFHGNLYGKQFSKAESKAKQKAVSLKSKEIVLGPKITASGWRPPRSRTPIPFAETPARFAPRPLKQPPQEVVPKSLHIVSIPTQNLKRPNSTPPRITTPNSDYIAQVLSESSLHNTGTSIDVHGPSTNISGTGSVPPPPSPEALVLPNELNMAVSTLEPLCEEDERSSRTTSIAEFVEKGVGNPRLSPLGGGSEISEESIDLPKELSEGPEGIEEEGHEEIQEKQEDLDDVLNQNNTKTEVEQPDKINGQDDATDQQEEPKEQDKEDERLNKEKIEDEVQEEEKETLDSNEPQATDLPQDDDPLEVAPPPESEEPRPAVSPQLMSPRRGSPEPAPQPPGSPEVTSDHDFTEGVDMELDLTAQLQAAMEGLDDFDLDDDDDDENNDDDRDDNIDRKDEDGNIDIKSEDKEAVENENSNPIENENNMEHNGDKKDDTNDGVDGKTDSNLDHTNDKENDTNKADGDDKMIPDTNNDDKNEDESKVAQSDLDKVDQEVNYVDRTSPLLEA